MTSRKFCEDCKYFKPDRSWYWFLLFPPMFLIFKSLKKSTIEFGECTRFPKEFANGVLSRNIAKTYYYAASVQRSFCGDCKPEGIAFEPKKGE